MNQAKRLKRAKQKAKEQRIKRNVAKRKAGYTVTLTGGKGMPVTNREGN